ncbi:uncharacterized protein CBL_11087 [Carabus blaptoides fortunei]
MNEVAAHSGIDVEGSVKLAMASFTSFALAESISISTCSGPGPAQTSCTNVLSIGSISGILPTEVEGNLHCDSIKLMITLTPAILALRDKPTTYIYIYIL